jgi:hypothetical protein
MAGQVLAGRPIENGWANQVSSIPGVETVTSGEFPADERTTRLTGAGAPIGAPNGRSGSINVNVAQVPLCNSW